MNNQILVYRPKLDENGKPVVRYANSNEPWLDASNGRLKFTATVLPVPIYEQVTGGWLMERCERKDATHMLLCLAHPVETDGWYKLTPLAQPEPTAEQNREKARIAASDAAHAAFKREWDRIGSGTSSSLNRALEAYQDAYEAAMKEATPFAGIPDPEAKLEAK